jgi:hypothetical protein
MWFLRWLSGFSSFYPGSYIFSNVSCRILRAAGLVLSAAAPSAAPSGLKPSAARADSARSVSCIFMIINSH